MSNQGRRHGLCASGLTLKTNSSEWVLERGNGNPYHDSHFGLVSSEMFNVLLDPLEGELLIKQAEVVMRSRDVTGGGEAEDVETVVQADHYDILVLGE